MPDYKTFISNYLSNVLRGNDTSAKYPNIIVDLRHVEPKYRQIIIDDIPLSLYSYNDICKVTLKTLETQNDIVYVHIDYYNTNKVKDEENVLFINLRVEPYIYQSSKYILYINIQDKYKTYERINSVYNVFFLTEELKLPHDWLKNNQYSYHREELEKKAEYIVNIDTYNVQFLMGDAITTESIHTIVFDSAYYIQHCGC